MVRSIDLLCRVVDNYGDIGVVWRLAKSLAALRPGLALRIITDHPEVFREILPAVEAGRPVQTIGPFTIVDWDHPWEGFQADPPRFVIEAFACGRPEHYDRILHDPDDPRTRLHLVLEYLSAETYAGELHLMPSLSGLPQVRRIYFMPGFSPLTGGLILDGEFIARRNRAWAGDGQPQARVERLRSLGIALPPDAADMAWLCLFSYEHDYRRLAADLRDWQDRSGRRVLVLAAAGRSAPAVRDALGGRSGDPAAVFLPFLPQDAWDEVLVSCDLAIVRGEESLARACLAGRPFIWHAYLQEDGYQRVKVAALVEALTPLLDAGSAAAAWRALMHAFNDRTEDSQQRLATESWSAFLAAAAALAPAFRRCAETLEKQGDCARNLLSCMDDFV